MKIYNPHVHLNLWLPLFIAWIILAALALAMSPIVLMVLLILWVLRLNDWFKALLMLGPSVYGCLCALRGLKLDIKDDQEILLFAFK